MVRLAQAQHGSRRGRLPLMTDCDEGDRADHRGNWALVCRPQAAARAGLCEQNWAPGWWLCLGRWTDQRREHLGQEGSYEVTEFASKVFTNGLVTDPAVLLMECVQGDEPVP